MSLRRVLGWCLFMGIVGSQAWTTEDNSPVAGGNSVAVKAAVPAPETFVRSGIDQTIQAITGSQTREERYEKVKVIFQKYFDLPRLAGFSLGGSAWGGLSEDEKNAFIEKYSEFVLRFYLGKLEGYNSNKIEVGTSEIKKGTHATVPTLIEIGNTKAKLKYSLILKDSEWKIYDVEIEGVRLSLTYREQFVSALNSKKFVGLIEDLDRLINKAKGEKT